MKIRKKEKFIVLAYLVILVVVFLGLSRFPALGEKNHLTDFMGLSFDVIANEIDSISYIENVFISSINWLYTNWKGMAFGLLFAAGFSVFARQFVTNSNFLNLKLSKTLTFLFVLPIGICANCIAPLSVSVFKRTGREDISSILALGSHGINFFALILLFQILPVEFGLVKVLSLSLIILIIVSRTKRKPEEIQNMVFNINDDEIYESSDSWRLAFKRIGILFSKELKHFIVKFVPLMVLSGFLGNLLYVTVPSNFYFNADVSFLKIILVSIFSIMLPVPMLFDIIFVSFLYKLGVPDHYLVVFLICLGPVSIYSLLLLFREKGFVTVFKLVLFLVSLSVFVSYLFVQVKNLRIKMILTENQSKFEKMNFDVLLKPGITEIKDKILIENSNQPQDLPTIHDLGFPIYYESPFYNKNLIGPSCIGSFLINNDLKSDFYIGGYNQLNIFINKYPVIMKQKITPDDLDLRHINHCAVFNYDENNKADLIVFDYEDNVRIVRDFYDGIESDKLIRAKLPRREKFSFVNAIAILDVDNDQDEDLVLGMYTVNKNELHSSKSSTNLVLFNNGDKPIFKEIKGDIPGETMSIAVIDIDSDGKKELLVANDFNVPDVIYDISEEGDVRKSKKSFKLTSKSTMSLSVADINNDLKDDYLFIDMGMYDEHKEFFCDSNIKKLNREHCEEYRSSFVESQQIEANCSQFKRDFFQVACALSNLKFMANTFKNNNVCDLVKRHKDPYSFCLYNPQGQKSKFEKNYFKENDITKQISENVLIDGKSNKNRSQTLGIENTYWGWNSHFFDFDNDMLLDLYVVNGEGIQSLGTPNTFFINEGQKFKRKKLAMAENYGHTKIFTVFDINRDECMDIVEQSQLGEIRLVLNECEKKGFSFRLFENRNGKECNNCTVLLTLSSGEKIKRSSSLSQGYRSFHDLGFHVGLGKDEHIISIQVNWPNEKITTHIDLKNRMSIFRDE